MKTVAAMLTGAVLAGQFALAPPGAAQSFGQGEIANDVIIGKKIAPVPLDTAGKNVNLVYLGSYIVNAQGGCNDCHTNPPYATGGNPFLGEREKINAARYLAGGMNFGNGIISRNLTPTASGLPAGLTLAKFVTVIRTGEDPARPGRLLQVMPWPIFKDMTNFELSAIYEYLSSIPTVGR